jgi:signal peptidase II
MSDQRGEGKKKVVGFIYIAYLLFVLGLFSLDQYAKAIVACHLLPGESVPLIKNVFHITFVQNPGIAFGLLRNKNHLSFVLFILGIIIFLFLFFCKHNYSRMGKIALAMIISGALSNLFDRVRFGYVIDYLDLRIWPVFNLADTVITIGISLLLLEFFKKEGITS